MILTALPSLKVAAFLFKLAAFKLLGIPGDFLRNCSTHQI